jgi:16S rRNA (cytosine1402-N4)-methyltransferase
MMTGGDAGQPAVAGGPARHIPVLARPAIDLLAVRDGGVYVDATFGAGGHSAGILAAASTSRVIAIDRDPTAIAGGADLMAVSAGRLTLVEARFSTLDAVVGELGHAAVNGVLIDLGVSSMQLDDPGRGFSFRAEGPLDMRMGADGPSAADIVARASEQDLADIIFTLGEERRARAVARAIVAARQAAPIRTTAELARIVARVVHLPPGGIDPATRTFQALRIFVNQELDEVAAALAAAERVLAPGARLVVIAFHSLEDRLVKTFLASRARPPATSRHLPAAAAPAPTFDLLTRKVVVADENEIAANPRARSAKLRAAERTAAPVGADQPLPLRRLPSLEDVMRGRR